MMFRLLCLYLLLLGCYAGHAQSTPDKEVTMCVGDTVTMSAEVLFADSLQWFRNDVPVPGAHKDTLVYLEGGLFYLRAYSGKAVCMDQSGDIRVFVTAPQTVDDHILVPLGKPVSFDALANDQPLCAPFDRNTFTIVSPPSIGTLTAWKQGYIVYKPSTTTIGTDRFTYRVRDVDGRLANEATVYLELIIDCAILYPNPVDQILHVTVNNKRIYALKIYDATGREMYRTLVDKTAFDIDISTYAQGIYIVDLLEKDGSGCTIKIHKK
ncbi:T9SS type A sorting domain-containing protein [Taibaiella koreensis]|uniref:T9SS type A sorting domain-containing protein n=1 Tax=Taibaiella koreensis TaxID=1268548 RepID=UPI000E59CB63|nr:T9SS type A sorting domain-containing protein [Taibaiella koreensis]